MYIYYIPKIDVSRLVLLLPWTINLVIDETARTAKSPICLLIGNSWGVDIGDCLVIEIV